MGFAKEFKEFAVKGNVMDMAVGVIIGAAFGKIIASAVNDLIMPIIAAIFGMPDFNNLYLVLKGNVPEGTPLADAQALPETAVLAYGSFITVAIDFLLIAVVIFFMVKAMNNLKRKKEEAPAPPPEPSATEKLLTEIRDALKSKS